MGSETGVKMLINLMIYFLCITFIFTGVNLISNEFGISDTTIQNNALSTTNKCYSPRSALNPSTTWLVVTQFDSISKSSTDCEDLDANELQCGDISGCTWQSTTAWFGLQELQYCSGIISVTDYGVGTQYTELEEDYITPSDRDICRDLDLDGVDNEDSCRLLGCTFTGTASNLNGVQGINVDTNVVKAAPSVLSTFIGIVGSMFTLNLDFGFESDFANVILNVFLVLLPLLMVIGAIIIIIRG